jgi:hypothetical protein
MRRKVKREDMKLRDIRCPIFGIGRVYVSPGFPRAFSILQHAHDVLRDVDTNGTTKGMIVKSDLPVGIHV